MFMYKLETNKKTKNKRKRNCLCRHYSATTSSVRVIESFSTFLSFNNLSIIFKSAARAHLCDT